MTNSLHPDSAAGDGTGSKSTTQRARWATRRLTVKSGGSKRMALLDRMQQGRHADGEKDDDATQDPHDPNADPDATLDKDEAAQETEKSSRTLYFNQPLPSDCLDEEGNPIHSYPRNKIRTAKYTPLSFVPKNLWIQFHNIANIYFLFLVILVVSGNCTCRRLGATCLNFATVFPHLWRREPGTQLRAANLYCGRHWNQRRH